MQTCVGQEVWFALERMRERTGKGCAPYDRQIVQRIVESKRKAKNQDVLAERHRFTCAHDVVATKRSNTEVAEYVRVVDRNRDNVRSAAIRMLIPLRHAVYV